jgi:hypothetical protein
MGLAQRKTSGRLNGGSKMVVVGQGIFSEKRSVNNSEKTTYVLDGKPGELVPCTFEEGKVNIEFNFEKGSSSDYNNVFAEYDPFYLKNSVLIQYLESNELKISQFNQYGEITTEYGFNTPLTFDSGLVNGIIRTTNNKFIIYGTFIKNDYGILHRINSDGSLDNLFNIIIDTTIAQRNLVATTDKYGNVFMLGINTNLPSKASLKFYNSKPFTSKTPYSITQFAKLKPNGDLDRNFNIVTTDNKYNTNFFFPQQSLVYGIKLYDDDKIYIYGNFQSYSGHSSGNIIRLNSNGFPDLTFNQETYITGTVYDIAFLSQNQIILVGSLTFWKEYRVPNIIKLTSGVIDNDFNDNLPLRDLNNKIISSVDIDYDGKILISGAFGFIRLNTDGTKDETFYNYSPFDGNAVEFKKSINKGYFLKGRLTNVQNLSFNKNIIKLKGC